MIWANALKINQNRGEETDRMDAKKEKNRQTQLRLKNGPDQNTVSQIYYWAGLIKICRADSGMFAFKAPLSAQSVCTFHDLLKIFLVFSGKLSLFVLNT